MIRGARGGVRFGEIMRDDAEWVQMEYDSIGDGELSYRGFKIKLGKVRSYKR